MTILFIGQSFTDASNATGVWLYWCEWPNQKGRFLASDEEPRWHHLKIRYLESKLRTIPDREYDSSMPLTAKYFKTCADIRIGRPMSEYTMEQILKTM